MIGVSIVNNDSEYDECNFASLTYVALGDSITYGANPFVPNSRVRFPYPDLVEIELLLYNSVNCGISGSTVATGANSYYPMVERYADMPHGDIISVLGGVNDYFVNIPLGSLYDTDATTFYGALNTLAKGLVARYPDAFVFFMTPYNCRWGDSPNANGNTLKQFVNAVKEVCAINGLPCLDMYCLGNFEMEMHSDLSDGVHPSQSFFRDYTAPQIAQFIRNNYGKQNPTTN